MQRLQKKTSSLAFLSSCVFSTHTHAPYQLFCLVRLLLYYNSTIPNGEFHILWWVIFMWKYLSVGELKDEILWVCQILTHFLYLHDDSWKTASRKDYQKKKRLTIISLWLENGGKHLLTSIDNYLKKKNRIGPHH